MRWAVHAHNMGDDRLTKYDGKQKMVMDEREDEAQVGGQAELEGLTRAVGGLT